MMIQFSYEYIFMVNGMVKRKIVKIDEDRCNGCGECIPSCEEGALKIIDGVAKIVKDEYCDGLGACLGHCPQDAISIIEREALEFDEEAVHEYLKTLKKEELAPQCNCTTAHAMQEPFSIRTDDETSQTSELKQWPVQLNLVPIKAPYWENADLLIMADCVPVSYPNLHNDLLKGRRVAIGCPKFDNAQAYVEKLTEILKQNDVRSLTVANMEVPCCSGFRRIAEIALEQSGKMIPSDQADNLIEGALMTIDLLLGG